MERRTYCKKVKATTIYKYEQGYLEIKEIYTGKDLEKKFGVDNLTRVLKIPVEAEAVGMKESEEKTFTTEKVTVLTRSDDPPCWQREYDYPQWTWGWEIIYIGGNPGVLFEIKDPINLA